MSVQNNNDIVAKEIKNKIKNKKVNSGRRTKEPGISGWLKEVVMYGRPEPKVRRCDKCSEGQH